VWCDTHCHLDAPEFALSRPEVIARARAAGVGRWIVPAVGVAGFDALLELASATEGLGFALGIHPLALNDASLSQIDQLDAYLTAHRNNPRLLAVGEIGLDLYPGHPDFEQQRWYFEQQLRLARRHDLPVIVHARRSADLVHAGLRRFGVSRGIVHAFNGSPSQARALIRQGMWLGFGGSVTFEGSRRIRRLAAELPLEALLLETDAPDIRPSWFAQGCPKPNEPAELPRIGACLAQLRAITAEELSTALNANLAQIFPDWTATL